MRRVLAPALLALAGCAGAAGADAPGGLALYQPPPGSNAVLREETHAAPGHELIVADLNLPADAVGEAHWHPWEEYLYVLAGSAVLDIEGLPPRTLSAGEHFVIPRETVHTPRAGPQGIRAITIRVHDAGDPVSISAAERRP